MKKTASFIFAALLAMSVIAGCGESADTPSQNSLSQAQTEAAAPDAETTEAPVTDVLDGIPDADYGGRTFNILLRTGFEYEFVSEEMTGDIINDAIYERNRTIEEKFNIKLGSVAKYTEWGSADTFNKTLDKAVMAGSQDYDLVAGYAAMILGAIKPGLVLNWLEMPNVDVSR